MKKMSFSYNTGTDDLDSVHREIAEDKIKRLTFSILVLDGVYHNFGWLLSTQDLLSIRFAQYNLQQECRRIKASQDSGFLEAIRANLPFYRIWPNSTWSSISSKKVEAILRMRPDLPGLPVELDCESDPDPRSTNESGEIAQELNEHNAAKAAITKIQESLIALPSDVDRLEAMDPICGICGAVRDGYGPCDYCDDE